MPINRKNKGNYFIFLEYILMVKEMFIKEKQLRIKIVFIGITIMFLLILGRIFYIQVFSYNKLNNLAEALWQRNLPITADRGRILDRNGKVLATNITTTTLYVVPNQVVNKDETAEKLASILECSKDDILKHLNKKTSLEKVNPEGRQLDSEKADLIIALFENENFDDEDKEILELIKDKNYIKVFNKKDLIKDIKENEIYISAKNQDINPLKEKIFEILGIKEENFSNPSLANSREIGLLEKANFELTTTIELANQGITIDILNEHIKNAYLAILEILGEDNNFDVAKEIFSRFCLGK